MLKEWTELTRLTGGDDIIVERVRLASSGIAIEGEFSLPVLAKLSYQEQIFVMAFVGVHGSIKSMEHMFGISYPTVKNRLEKLADRLKMVESVPGKAVREIGEDVLGMLEKGEISAEEAIRRLNQ